MPTLRRCLQLARTLSAAVAAIINKMESASDRPHLRRRFIAAFLHDSGGRRFREVSEAVQERFPETSIATIYNDLRSAEFAVKPRGVYHNKSEVPS